ncbi:Modification methylase MjaI [Candidatus Bilamarchaeum dharawalense]|uniref:Type II methyltransferase n=1 Tax=Candidatus Bilamarchaeum dharawalense TaxID=2885759 RepID=A0A5E4LSW6_9ARCH|nr:Modification methylase MjaI [Candidatus Bilamarchaeum dharawalense]
MSKTLVVIGDARNMVEVRDDSIQLIITSPPYFNVKDYGTDNIGSINDYRTYLMAMRQVFSECYRVVQEGRYICVNVSDITSEHKKYPIPCHLVGLLQRVGFEYRDDIIWKKPSGIGSKSSKGGMKRFGVFIQNPYPMYFYPNNLYEHVLVFRKGKFDFKKLTEKAKQAEKLDLEHVKKYWSNDVWEIHPESRNKISGFSHPAMFPEELPKALISLYSYKGETVLDPFLGSGTTSKVARQSQRNSIGYEINEAFLGAIKSKTGYQDNDPDFEIIVRKRRGENNEL